MISDFCFAEMRLPSGFQDGVMTDYLDTGDIATNNMTIVGIPNKLNSGGYGV